jgi:hypothetical protein
MNSCLTYCRRWPSISVMSMQYLNRALTSVEGAIDQIKLRLHIGGVNQTTFGDSRFFTRLRATCRSARQLALAVNLLVMTLPTACARQLVQIPQPVGPNPTGASRLSTGRLVVHTEETATPYDENQSTTYRPYAVLDSSQQIVLEVDNASGADVVELPPGHYTVRMDGTQYRTVTVPVRVVVGRTTEAHLDGKWKPEVADPRMLIQGPDGSPIGYRADVSLNDDRRQ